MDQWITMDQWPPMDDRSESSQKQQKIIHNYDNNTIITTVFNTTKRDVFSSAQERQNEVSMFSESTISSHSEVSLSKRMSFLESRLGPKEREDIIEETREPIAYDLMTDGIYPITSCRRSETNHANFDDSSKHSTYKIIRQNKHNYSIKLEL